ncbi:hypothetical protein [Granulibacter bethesdensis]|uniref:Glycosyltransferase n=1 Tax=Granulibacter bethesdensis (strain ATCC BAA-1260 / CGDNIH1) TaxID=391165 RepID=Q0BUF8_GRABC|nr:hypothetical protein [Granulibacter bethesdensis]ABI61544.1 Glycosyltransferase [Granulibacter bethesdensis CGDNIH1]AHJ67680.1 Glycosyltransferase [Granulibacter bethesdensis]APH51342.1 Glycosyltransferase [Granulibacter bethesdensis]APH64035.1 Glycosyltransferase [Granulibacter bethesdensis]
MNRSFRHKVLLGGLIIAILAALWSSLHTSFDAFGFDSDNAAPYVVWQGIRQNGLSFISSWHATQDNWLFSLYPFYYAAFETIGPAALSPAWAGWAVFVALCAMGGILTARLAGPLAGLTTAALMLAADCSAVAHPGYLAHPVSHNISLFWGLAGLLAACCALTPRNRWGHAGYILLSVLAFMIGGLSDPWLNGAMLLPAIAACGWVLITGSGIRERVVSVALAIALAGALELDRTRIFGQATFLASSAPQMSFSPERAWPALKTALLIVPAWFNPVPLGHSALTDRLSLPAIIACIAFAIATIILLLPLRRSLMDRTSPQLRFITATALLSYPAILVLFLLVFSDPAFESLRFFIAPFALWIIAGVSLAARRRADMAAWQQYGLTTYAVLIVIAGLLSGRESWSHPLKADTQSMDGLSSFLVENGLSYGYGPYGEDSANAVHWVSHGKVTLRSVHAEAISGHITEGGAQTSDTWYEASDIPPNTKDIFLIMPHHWFDCGKAGHCEETAVQQFGPPARILHYKDNTIMVWPYSIWTDPAAIAANLPPIALGKAISFGAQGEGLHLLGKGWSNPEATGTWSDGANAWIRFRLPEGATYPLHLSFSLAAFTARHHDRQHIGLFANQHFIGWFTTSSWDDRFEAIIPAPSEDKGKNGVVVLKFALPDAVKPSSVMYSADDRNVAILLHTMTVDTKHE